MSSSKHRRTHSEAAASVRVKVSEDFLVSKGFTINSDRGSKGKEVLIHSEIFLKNLKSFSEDNKEAEDQKELKLR
jgi:hypothetical protein